MNLVNDIVVEDSTPESYELLRETLLEHTDFKLKRITLGADLISNTDCYETALILMDADHASPELNQAISQVQDRGESSNIPIVLFSNNGTSEKIASALQHEIEDFIQLPIHPKLLHYKINHLLKTRKNHSDILDINQRLSINNKVIGNSLKNAVDSINYAQNIQLGMLPGKSKINRIFRDSFVLYEPKDTVGGDFYYFEEINGTKIAVAADCVGHGISGALLSMVGYNLINDAVINQRKINPDEILSQINKGFKKMFNKTGNNGYSHGGIDLAVICIDVATNEVTYSGAKRPLVIARKHDILLIKGDNMWIGNDSPDDFQFKSHTLQLEPDDVLYLFSDGFVDQFGGDLLKKFGTRKLMELIGSIYRKSLNDQKGIFKDVLNDWKGNSEQIDDILLIGMKNR